MDCEDRQIHRPALFVRRKRRVKHPAHARTRLAVAAGGEDRSHRQSGARDIHPVRQVVHPREGHVRRTDVQRHEVVAKAAEQRRDHHEEHHQDAVGGDQHVPQMAVRGAGAILGGQMGQKAFADILHAHVLHARVHQFHPHVDREGHRDEADDRGGEKVKDADILVVRRHEPPGKEPGVAMFVVAMNGCVGHADLPFRLSGRI